MPSSTGDTTKKKRALQTGTPVMVRLQPDQLALVDAWRERHGVKSRPEALRQMVAALIRMEGLDS